jgi:hypothetical protein
MAPFPKSLKDLCTPAAIYFVLSIIGLIIASLQNMNNRHTYCLGMATTRVSSTVLVLVLKLIYVLFWTWILNLICRDGHKGIAWFLVFFPFILLFLLMLILLV